jgi:hypothetical protein
MAHKSDGEIQIMEGFTSTSDSDNRRCDYHLAKWDVLTI